MLCGDCAESFSIVRWAGPSTAPLARQPTRWGAHHRRCHHRRAVGPIGESPAPASFRVFDMSVAATGLVGTRSPCFGIRCRHQPQHQAKTNPNTTTARRWSSSQSPIARQKSCSGVQIVGYEGVDKRIDVLVTAHDSRDEGSGPVPSRPPPTRPPFATTKDPSSIPG